MNLKQKVMVTYKSPKRDKQIKKNSPVVKPSNFNPSNKKEEPDVVELRKVLKRISREFLNE